jgi:hypothetical protein
MNRVRGQLLAGIGYFPVVDVNHKPIILGCTLEATVATYKGSLSFHRVTVVVTSGYLPQCVIRGEGWCIPFYYNHELRLMVGANVSETFPVWCEVLPPPSHFTR